MQLAFIPVDILVGITELLEAEDVGCLWFCGSSVLNASLSHGGVRKWALQLKPWTKMVWPRLMASMPFLTDLSIATTKQAEAYAVEGVNWKSLPATMTRIEANFLNDAKSFFSDLHALDLPRLQYLSLSGYNGVLVLDDATLNMREHLASLKTLKLPNVVFELFPVALLPRNLKHLAFTVPSDSYRSLATLCGKSDGPSIPEWPPMLSELSLRFVSSCDHLSLVFPILPRMLRSCTISVQHKTTWDANHFKWSELPPLLELLSIDETDNLEPSHLAQLPQTLTALHVFTTNPLSEESLAALPRGLKSLRRSVLDLYDTEHALALPRGLTEIDETTEILLDVLPSMPHGLKTLVVMNENKVPWPKNFVFSPSLTFLYLGLPQDDVFTHLPSHLTKLSSWNGKLTPGILKTFPTTLQYLSLNYPEPEDNDGLAFDDIVELLPPNLTELHLFPSDRQLRLSEKTARLFPRSLTLLDINTGIFAEEGIFDRWVSALPRSLTSLHVILAGENVVAWPVASDWPPMLEYLLVYCKLNPPNGYSRFLGGLPRKLLTCKLISQPESGLDNSDLARLPPGLCSLHLPQSRLVTLECRPHLPRYLSSLRLGKMAPDNLLDRVN